jgi:hypothetical protein
VTNLEIIENLYKAFAVGDVPSVLANMHKDIIWNEAENFPYSDNNPYIGPQSVLEADRDEEPQGFYHRLRLQIPSKYFLVSFLRITKAPEKQPQLI